MTSPKVIIPPDLVCTVDTIPPEYKKRDFRLSWSKIKKCFYYETDIPLPRQN
jgi:hypothetical protein